MTPPEQAEPGAVERLTIYANQSSIDTQHGRDLRRDLRTLLADLARMKAALEPFAHRGENPNAVLHDDDYLRAADAYNSLALRQHEDGR